jgi:hypothetical protein
VDKTHSDFEFEILSDESETDESCLPASKLGLHEYLSAVFDSVLDELRAEELSAAAECKPERKRPEVLPESAASIEETQMEDVSQRLRELLPKVQARREAGVEFDEEIYQELKPLFMAILDHDQKQSRE